MIGIIGGIIGGFLVSRLDISLNTDDAVRKEAQVADELDEEKPAIDAKLRYAQWGEFDPRDRTWTFSEKLSGVDIARIEEAGSDPERLAKVLRELGAQEAEGAEHLDKSGHSSSAMTLTLSSEREKLVTVTDIFAEKIKCWESKAKATIVWGAGEGFPRDHIVFKLHKYDIGEKIPAVAEKFKDEAGSAETIGEIVEEPFLKTRGIALQKGLLPSEFSIDADSHIGCEWALKVSYEVQGSSKKETLAVKGPDGRNPRFSLAPIGQNVQVLYWNSEGRLLQAQ
ncbi:hypothetical protein [Streptomyces capparidis]